MNQNSNMFFNKFSFFIILKTLACLVIIVFFTSAANNFIPYMIFGFIEILIVSILGWSIAHYKPRIGWLLNSLLTLIILIQFGVLRFGGSFLSPIMISNIRSISAMSGKATNIIIVSVITFLISIMPLNWPIKRSITTVNYWIYIVLAILLITDCVGGIFLSNTYSPFKALGNLGVSMYRAEQTQKELKQKMQASGVEFDNHFFETYYHDAVNDYVPKPDILPNKPNIVLIFTEGLSQSIIEDSRNLMPNVLRYQENSLNFINYYNHTAATYRGLIGQLYSGHQMHNNDTNNLISIQGILKDQGYDTLFINSEPDNSDFTDYLNAMDFDRVLTTEKADGSWYSDKEIYQILWDELESARDSDKPMFTALYTFCTHASLDSDDEKYEDGKEPILNKFYNLDYQFGNFMDLFAEDSLSDNTIFIFTSDHATYVDEDYINAFSASHPREDSFCDRIPFFIWYKGVDPKNIDAQGRNSLDLTPTLLDFLDITAPNYFLGQSLFADINSADSLETFFAVSVFDWFVKTDSGIIQTQISNEEKEAICKKINDYFIGTMQSENSFD